MIYVFDTGPFISLFKHYYKERFPTLWDNFDALIKNGTIISVSEVRRELNGQADSLTSWANDNKSIFLPPDAGEAEFISDIFSVNHFQTLIRSQERLEGKPVADPFVIAKAKELDSVVVTQEKKKPNAAKMPNVCDHFGVDCMNLEEFMKNEDWTF